MADNGSYPAKHRPDKPAQGDERPPWESSPHWHPSRRKAFEIYRDLGPERSIRRVRAELGKSDTLIGKWSKQDGWVERAAAWDMELDRVRREEFYEGTADVSRAQAEAAGAHREALLEPALAVRRRIERLRAKNREPFDDMDLASLLRLTATAGRALAQVVQVERLARGMSTDNVAGHDGGPLVPEDVERKTTAELEAYLTGRADEREQLAPKR